ncbi:MAG: hypothetical protein LPL29_14985 [Alphaproteobacteria bacterium]|nr:hypothetical protein [Alphaproteobacteria bacterium]
MKKDLDEKRVNPDAGLLISPRRYELEEAQRIIINCAIIALQTNRDVHKSLSRADRDKIVASIKKAPLEELHRRLAALSVQNPGILAQALKESGYGIRVDPDGNVAIDPNTDGVAGAGRYITEAEFERL